MKTELSSPFPPERSLNVSSGDVSKHPIFKIAQFNHLNFDVPADKECCPLLQGLCLSPESAFEDCYFHLPFENQGDETLKRQWWLRHRTKLDPREDLGFTLGESWKGIELFSGVNEFHGKEVMQKLACLGINVSSLESFEVMVKFRFFRRSFDTRDFGLLNLDRTLYGTRLIAKVNAKAILSISG